MKNYIILCFFLISGCFFAQKDHIYVYAELSENLKNVVVNQEIIFHNKQSKSITRIKLLNWIAA